MSIDSKPLISVITLAYNHSKFIGSCIESVIAQTYSRWEQVIIDDGSTDDTAEVVMQYRDTRIRYYRQEKQGIENLAKTYNRALVEARGSLIAILEGDDLWPPGKLSRMVPLFDDTEVVLAHGEAMDVDANGVVSRRIPRIYRDRAKLPRKVLFNEPVGSSTAYLLTHAGQSFVTTATVLLRRSALDVIGGFQYVPGQCSPDIPTFVRLSTKGRFYYVSDLMGFRRRHLGSATLQHLSTMPAAAHRYALHASNDPVLNLNSEEQELVRRSWKRALQKALFTQGRISLINRNWRTARQQFLSVLSCGEGRFMLAGGIGWTLSWFHRDLESLFRIAGRTPLAIATAQQERVEMPRPLQASGPANGQSVNMKAEL